MSEVPIIRHRAELRSIVSRWKAAGERVGVVPTMGALHEGHLALVRAARAEADRVIVTLFVNPKQFNSAADLAAYPRTEESDAAKLAPLGVDMLYAPEADQIYPDGFATTVSVSDLTDVLCGAFRPGHFDGVATVVTKLLLQTGADIAAFGEKDYQQLRVVTRLVADLDIPVRILPVPTMREPDGLALSSRNLRLHPRDRAIAPILARVLREAATDLRGGAQVARTLDKARLALLGAGFGEVEYLDLRRSEDLRSTEDLVLPSRLFVAAWLGGVRLIDNLAIEPLPLGSPVDQGRTAAVAAL